MPRSKTVYVAKVDNLRYDCHFVATNDQTVWKDTPDANAIRSAIDNKSQDNEVSMDSVIHISWTPVVIEPGFSAQFKNNKKSTEKYGDTPTEATKYLDFPEVYSIDRDPVTSSSSIDGQIVDILRNLTGSVHYTTINSYLNTEELSDQYSNEDIQTELIDLQESGEARQTRDGNEWWTASTSRN